jgi:selenide, water dikinase
MKNNKFDLLTTVEVGGCSAKISPSALNGILKDLPFIKKKELIVGTESCDDAAVWKINEESAVIQTLDFFPPVCSDPYDFGQIAAANALNDVFAMGGKAVLALNIVMFPSKTIEMSVLKEILRGGSDKINESGAILAGGHTIEDSTPKYGLSVTGTVNPNNVISNSNAVAGDVLILTKAIGTGTVLAGNKINEVKSEDLTECIESMKLLAHKAAEIMQKYKVKCATDITGFGLLGHALEIASGSNTNIIIDTATLPLLSGVYSLTEIGCIPGASFKNLRHVEDQCSFDPSLDYNLKMLACDAQTSGGLLMCCPKESADSILEELLLAGYSKSTIIGKVRELEQKNITLI